MSNSLRDTDIRQKREANRQKLLEQAAHIPKDTIYPFPKPIALDTSIDGKVTYHSADNTYVYGIDEHGNNLQIAHASNSFYSPVIHKIISAVKDAIADANGNYAAPKRVPLKMPSWNRK